MYTTIGDLYGAAQVKAKPATKFGKDAQGKPVAIDGLQKPQMPTHEVNVDKPTHMHQPEDAQQQFDFLKQAIGGPPEGFVTKSLKSHGIAQKLARSGHLMHIQEMKHGNGQMVHHWKLTPKGASVVGQTRKM